LLSIQPGHFSVAGEKWSDETVKGFGKLDEMANRGDGLARQQPDGWLCSPCSPCS
jgi:hypothetical protein